MNLLKNAFIIACCALANFILLPATAQQMAQLPENLKISFNGTFLNAQVPEGFVKCSENGAYRCQYETGAVGDEIREIKNFRLFHDQKELFYLSAPPGSDMMISNQGYVVFFDTKLHFRGEVSLNFYSDKGWFLFSSTVNRGELFGFSSDGKRFLAGNSSGLTVFELPGSGQKSFPGGDKFAFSPDSRMLVVAHNGMVKLISGINEVRDIRTGLSFIRKAAISPENDVVAVIDKYELKAYSILTGDLIFSKVIDGNFSFRDIRFIGESIFAGIHYRYNGESTGIIHQYNLKGELVLERKAATRKYPVVKEGDFPPFKAASPGSYTPVSWPFMPFNEVHTVWNHYEQHMGDGSPDFSYLHQGLDIIVPVNEPIYAVEEGWVKCLLTTSTEMYWRLAISPVQVTGYSDGWMYAHLIESSIQFDVGDHVNLHDYLGDIIYWSSNWGHTHFVQIHDHGQVWSYADDEWGINFNPLLALTPITDNISPVIEPVFTNSTFGFCLNETSTYLDPDNLHGNIDIIVKISDYMGDSPWEQPGFKTWYWVKRIFDDSIVFPKTLGQVLNHAYSFYAATHFEAYAPVIYKRDNYFPSPYWMDEHRDFYQVLTNNNGDTLISLPEKNLSFHTTDYVDGDYRIFVEVWDESGNNATDSMDVVFNNGITGLPGLQDKEKINSRLFPNPVEGEASFDLQLPDNFYGTVKVTILNSLFQIVGTPFCKTVSGSHFLIPVFTGTWSQGVYYTVTEIPGYRKMDRFVVVKQ